MSIHSVGGGGDMVTWCMLGHFDAIQEVFANSNRVREWARYRQSQAQKVTTKFEKLVSKALGVIDLFGSSKKILPLSGEQNSLDLNEINPILDLINIIEHDPDLSSDDKVHLLDLIYSYGEGDAEMPLAA